ncbi:hypothetical protein J6Z19_06635 [bacterium]|nr:hypothetical protein [bacterium]
MSKENAEIRTDGFFEKRHPEDKIWWYNDGSVGTLAFSFDKKRIINLFSGYPWELTKEEKELFDKENPYWADFFSDRK